MFKATNEKELLNILKIIAEESVSKAKKTLNESKDSAQERYKSHFKSDESMYNVKLKEEDDVQENPPEEEVDTGEEDETSEVDLDLDPEAFGESFDGVIKDLNTLRSGKSTKNKEIKEELMSYYERLDEEERKILHLFLRELSDILTGAIDGDEAQDPSDPPFNIDVIIDTGDGDKQQKKTSSKKEKRPRVKVQSDSGSEDISPPIKVNESQDLNEIRKRVKRLMKRY